MPLLLTAATGIAGCAAPTEPPPLEGDLTERGGDGAGSTTSPDADPESSSSDDVTSASNEPAVAQIEPPSGVTTGGETVTLRGAGLGAVSKVWFGEAEGEIEGAPTDSLVRVRTPRSPGLVGAAEVFVATTGARKTTDRFFDYRAVVGGEVHLSRFRQNNLYESVSLNGWRYESPIEFGPPAALEQCAPWTLPNNQVRKPFTTSVDVRGGGVVLLSAPWVSASGRHELFSSSFAVSSKIQPAAKYDVNASSFDFAGIITMPSAPSMPYPEADASPTSITKGQPFVAKFSSALPPPGAPAVLDYNEVRINGVARCYTTAASSFSVPANVTAMGTGKTLLGVYRHHVVLAPLGDGTFLAVGSHWGKFVTATL